ncbi:MAG: hypothetical protein IJ943_01755 [Akkermansia sp.]|nr:hypothetical protein [Akkermansia sp.]
MAAPKLKVNAPAAGARPKLAVAAAPAARVKLNAGAAPTKRPALKGADGKAIAPKPTPAPEPEPEVAVAAPTTAAPTPAPAPEPTPAPVVEETPTVLVEPTPEPEPAPEPAPEPTPEPETAVPSADEEAAAAEAAAQAEYERQMEEYNRQMEEYNRQMAAYEAQQQAEAAAAAAAAPEPADEPTPEPAIAVTPVPAVTAPKAKKPAAGLKPAAAKPAAAKKKAAPQAAPAPASEGDAEEERLSARDAYLQQLQTMAEKKPFHKTPGFFIGIGALVAIAAGCFAYVSKSNAEQAVIKARVDATNAILQRAAEINKLQIETYADAQAKGVDVKCSKEDAECLLDMVVNPNAKDENGRPLYGARPKQTAQLACLLLGIASEMDPSIDNLIFSTLDKNASKMDADLFRALVQRIAVSNNKGINSKFRKLADSVSQKPKWPKKGQVLSYIWESMGLRVSEKDIPDIIGLLKSDDLEGALADSLVVCLNNIITMEESVEQRQKLGDQIFDSLPEQYRKNMQAPLGRSCSPKALEFYKSACESADKWHDSSAFFANYYSDDIIPYLLELKAKAQQMVDEAGEEKAAARKAADMMRAVEFMISGVVSQNRPRELAEANKLIELVYDKINVDTSGYADTEEGSEARAEMDACFKQKERLISNLSSMTEHEWVTTWLEKLRADDDPDISNKARLAQQKVKENTAHDATLHANYKARQQQK